MAFFDKIKGWFGGKTPPDGESESERVESEPAAEADAPESAEPIEEPTRRKSSAAEDARTESEGRALFGRGDAAGAIAWLDARGILLAGHAESALPCLCKRCLRPEVGAAEVAGVAYVRDFVLTRHHVLFYWMPRELVADAKRVRASMRSEVRHRLRKPLAGAIGAWRKAANPFATATGKPAP